MSAERILVVEDEGIISLDIQNRLRSAGYIIAGAASSGQEAIEQAISLQPDLILMDIKLQGQLDGIEAAHQIVSRLNTPIIYLTAYADEETLKRARATAVFGYLLKPFKERELVVTVEMALARHKLERQLKESEQWFSTLLNSINDAVIATDEQGRVKFMNPLAETLTGWRQSEAAGTDADQVFQVFDTAKQQRIPCPVKQVLSTGERSLLQNSASLLTHNKAEIHTDYSAAPIMSDQGKIIGVALIFRDVTERKKAEELLLQAQKMESLGLLAGGVAHDFNNLLAAILGQISLAQAKLPQDNKIAPHLTKALHVAEQAAELTRLLLIYSGRGQFRWQPISLNDFVEKNRQLLQAAIPKSIEIQLDLTDSRLLIDADPTQMQQLIMNLILNAAEAIGDQAGAIALRTNRQTITDEDSDYWRYTGKALPPGEYALLEVADTGYGIPPDLASNLFEPFFTTKPMGRGLGLPAVLGAVRGHQGGIYFDNQMEGGALFKLIFPISQQKALPVVVESSPSLAHETINSRKVLVIDDEHVVQDAISDMLELEEIEVITAADGLAGVLAYQEHVADIGLILLDLSMPVMDGAQAFQRLREINPQARIILMSGYDRQDVMHKHDWQGLTAFIPKPFTVNNFLDIVLRHLQGNNDSPDQR